VKKKTILAALVIVSILVVSIVVGYYEANQTNPSPEVSFTPQVSPTPVPTSTSAALPTPTAAAEPTQPTYGYYLPLSNGSISRIFVISANASYGSYPGSSRFFNDKVVVEKGEPCYIINATVRTDYSAQNPPPNYHPSPNSYLDSNYTFVSFMANIYNGQTKLKATDLDTVGLPPQVGFYQIAFAKQTLFTYT
jgi:hypothetical protein